MTAENDAPSERQIVTALIREWAEREPRISTKDVTGPDFYAVWSDIARNLLASDWLASRQNCEAEATHTIPPAVT